MHVLRSTYLPAYQSLIRSPYTSDPFPTASPSPSSISQGIQPIQSLQRETTILDRFIALKVREDVLVDESEFHLEREDMFKDLFDHAQPKARLEDLVRRYGVREGVVSIAQHSSTASRRNTTNNTPPLSPMSPSTPTSTESRSSTSRFFSSLFSGSKSKSSVIPTPYPPSSPLSSTPQRKIKPIPFSRLSISLSPRTISLILGSGTNRRTLVQIQRDGRDMKLEVGAKRIVKELKNVLVSEAVEGKN